MTDKKMKRRRNCRDGSDNEGCMYVFCFTESYISKKNGILHEFYDIKRKKKEQLNYPPSKEQLNSIYYC